VGLGCFFCKFGLFLKWYLCGKVEYHLATLMLLRMREVRKWILFLAYKEVAKSFAYKGI